jgi:hypothetical protein
MLRPSLEVAKARDEIGQQGHGARMRCWRRDDALRWKSCRIFPCDTNLTPAELAPMHRKVQPFLVPAGRLLGVSPLGRGPLYGVSLELLHEARARAGRLLFKALRWNVK